VGSATPASITDGLSNTACYSEILGYPRPDRSRLIYSHQTDEYQCTDAPSIAARCRSGRIGVPVFMFPRGSDWVHGILQVNQYMHAAAPNERECLFTPNTASEHRGGVHTAFCDGSVRFVSNSVSDTIWQAAGSRATHDGPVEW
jgi:prepilin-type processing-associated H-X9-DG protein